MWVKNVVKNVVGTGAKKCRCGSWKIHWENFSGAISPPKKCGAKGCDHPPEVGAHITKTEGADRKHYIVLLCRQCNARLGQELELEKYVRLAWANVRETCGSEASDEVRSW